MNAVSLEMNGTHAAIERRVIVLASGGDANELRLNVLSDHADLFQRELPPGEAGESGGGCNHQRGRAGDAGAGRRFGVGFESEAALGRKEADQVGGERMRKLFCATKFVD